MFILEAFSQQVRSQERSQLSQPHVVRVSLLPHLLPGCDVAAAAAASRANAGAGGCGGGGATAARARAVRADRLIAGLGLGGDHALDGRHVVKPDDAPDVEQLADGCVVPRCAHAGGRSTARGAA